MDNTKLNKLQNTIVHITTENQLLKAQNYGLKEALINEKKLRKRSKALFEELRTADGQGATFFSPLKIKKAKTLQVHKGEAKMLEKHQKEAAAAAKKVQHKAKQDAAAATTLQR
ncbi:hypothetical protein M433DRAFT_1376 [Acidomyces richmondensis BFW]|nr:MAG: hypothetical protein FE78DRAFT_33764 [Acidomyces sp. 'richmondensis']KYG49173.1 hypothetical protein M433DRAFT_1376 [Acidomyces richmondensis BFW]